MQHRPFVATEAQPMPIRLARIAVASLLVVGLQGCMTALYLADRPSQAVLDEMARRCAEDSGIHWFGPKPEGVDLWLPGKMTRDPAEDPGRTSLTPYTSYSADQSFLSSGLARAIYVEIRPTTDHYFGPGPNDPAGTYRFRMVEEGDPLCKDEIAHYAAFAARSGPGATPYRRPDGKCLTWDRVGPLDTATKANVFIRFNDEPAQARGLYRDGEVLIVDGSERARFTSYWAINPNSSPERRGQWGIKACYTGPLGTPAIMGREAIVP